MPILVDLWFDLFWTDCHMWHSEQFRMEGFLGPLDCKVLGKSARPDEQSLELGTELESHSGGVKLKP